VTPDADVAIRFEDVSKSFGERRVLDAVSFEVPRASAFCLLGRSGSGKSVTLKHIIGLMRPDAGHVYVQGEDVTRLDRRALSRVRQGMGFLFQEAALFDSITVGENVAFPLRRHRRLADAEVRRIAQEKLDQVGLAREYHTMPAELSGGMRKRAGLARAMALDPTVLLVDEPSAGLDPITANEIDALLLGLKQHAGTTLLVVTHNIPSARAVGDELAVLHEGRIVERGTAAVLDRSSHPLVQVFMQSRGGG
jgi:phospholipid/cholesterol/gamma-HCH transport system ATP-binding protein